MSLVERIGGVLAAPRVTLRAALAGPPGRATSDVAWLLMAKVICGNLPHIVRAWFRAVELGPAAGAAAFLGVIGEALPDVIGILVGGMLLSLFDRGRKRRPPAQAGALDLAACAWIPYFAVELVAAIALGVLGAPAWLRDVGHVVALGWAAVVWSVGLIVLQSSTEAP